MKKNNYAVLTGDVVNSSSVPTHQWLQALKSSLCLFGNSGAEWEIFRGDSFQLLLKQPYKAVYAALIIKASLKQVDDNLDARIAIGFGPVDYLADQVSQCNGPAFVKSGALFDQLGKKTFAIDDTESIQIMLNLAQLVIDSWTSLEAETILAKLQQPAASQNQLAALLNTKQSRISERLKGSGYEEIKHLMNYFETNYTSRET